jgi:hypothetical protein
VKSDNNAASSGEYRRNRICCVDEDKEYEEEEEVEAEVNNEE